MAFTNDEINAYVQSILNNSSLSPSQQADQINQAASAAGVSREQLADATGYSLDRVNGALGLNGSTYSGPSGTSWSNSDGQSGFYGPYGAPAPSAAPAPTPTQDAWQSAANSVVWDRANDPNQVQYQQDMQRALSPYTGSNGLVGATPAAPTPAPTVYSGAPTPYIDSGLTKPTASATATAGPVSQPMYQQQPTLQQYQKNPYLDQMAAGITQQMTDNLQRNVLPGMRSGAMAAGGFGGSRQGVVEANALNDFNNGLGTTLTNMYATDYTNQMNRNLQKYGMDQGYNLGLGNLGLGYMNSQNNYDLGLRSNDLGFANLDASIYNSNFNNALNAANLGLNTYSTMNNSNNNALNTATNIYNTPLNYSNYFTGAFNQTAGQGGSTSQTATGSPLTGAIGGAYLANSMFNSKHVY